MAKKETSVQPIGGHILVKPLVEDTKTASGIVLPDSAEKEKKQKGTIVALGTGKIDKDGKKVAFSVKTGDNVIYKKYSPEEIEIEGEDYLIMEEEDILAVIK